MTAIRSRNGMSQTSVKAVITRADGTIENLGTISFWHKNPLKRFAYRIRRLFGWLH